MPANSTGLIEIVVDVVAQAAHEFSTQDTIAHVSQIPSGGTVLSLPETQPSDGDVYAFADLDGTCSASHPLHVTDPNGHDIAGSATQTFTTAFAWGVVRYDAKARLWSLQTGTAGGGPSGTASNLLVFQPNGTAGGNVFTDFGLLHTAAVAINGPILLYVDGTDNGNAATVPALGGPWHFPNPETLIKGPWNVAISLTLTLQASLSGVLEFEDIIVQQGSQLTPALSFASGTTFLKMTGTVFLGSATTPLVEVSGAGTSLQIDEFRSSEFGDGVNATITTGAGATTTFALQDDSSLNDLTPGGGGTYQCFVFSVAAFNGSNIADTLDTFAALLGYNDSLVAPALGVTQVQAAIDALKQGKPLTLWQDKAAGVAVAVAAQSRAQFFGQDTNAVAASGTYTFPAHGTALAGQEVTISLEGNAVNTPVNLAPGANNVLADPNNAGQYGGAGVTVVAATPGQVIRVKYDDLGASGKWRPF